MRWLALMLGLALGACSAAPVANMSEKDLDGACYWGHTKACTELGRVEYKKRNYPKAAKLFRKACKKGDPKACCNLGGAYWTGRGVTKDFAKAGELLTRACDAGVTVCCTNLGLMHKTQALKNLKGEEVVALFEKACAEGNKLGCFEAGYMYDVGEHIPRDLPKAIAAYEKVCSKRFPAACANLGRLYRRGEAGIEYNIAKAHHYYQLACNGKDGDLSCVKAKSLKGQLDCRQICTNLDGMLEAGAKGVRKRSARKKLKRIKRAQPHCMQGCLRDGTIKIDCALKAKTVEEFLPCSNY